MALSKLRHVSDNAFAPTSTTSTSSVAPMRIVTNETLGENDHIRWALNITNAILADGVAAAAVFLPVFKRFQQGSQLTAEQLHHRIMGLGDIPLKRYDTCHTEGACMVAFPYGIVDEGVRPFIGITRDYLVDILLVGPGNRHNLCFDLVVCLLHECGHVLTPTMNEELGIPAGTPTPEHIGHLSGFARGDCGCGVEQELFDGAVLTHFTAWDQLYLIVVHNPMGTLERSNIRTRALPSENVRHILQQLDLWAALTERLFPVPVSFWSWCPCRTAPVAAAFPITAFISYANFNDLGPDVQPPDALLDALPDALPNPADAADPGAPTTPTRARQQQLEGDAAGRVTPPTVRNVGGFIFTTRPTIFKV